MIVIARVGKINEVRFSVISNLFSYSPLKTQSFVLPAQKQNQPPNWQSWWASGKIDDNAIT